MFETKAIWFVKIISLKFGGLREWLNEQIDTCVVGSSPTSSAKRGLRKKA